MRKSEESSDSDRSLQKFLRKRDSHVLREYYSGVPAETLHRRYIRDVAEAHKGAVGTIPER